MRLIDYLHLTRIHNVVTALADIWAGFFLMVPLGMVQALGGWGRLAGLMVASGCIYSAGMVFNDVFDVARDRRLHPERPLPSGRVSVRSAAIFGAALQVIGLAAAAFAGWVSVAVAALVVGLTFSYNARLKSYRIAGSANMAACRFGNLVLGMSVAAPGQWEWVFPGLLFLYVLVVTLISTLEESERARPALAGLLVLLGGVLALLAVQACRTVVVYVLGLLALWIAVTALPALRRPSGPAIGQIVRVGLTGIIVFDTCMLLGGGQAQEAKVLALVLVPSYLLARLLKPGAGS